MFRLARFAFVLTALSFATVHAQSTEPTTEATTEPSAQRTKVSAEAQKLIEQINAAYSKPKSFEFDGHFTFNFDAAGQKDHREADFTSSFSAPNLFHHELKGDLLLAATGEQLYAELIERNQYMTFDAPKTRSAEEVAGPVREMLAEQNPALLLAISATPASALLDGAASVDRVDDIELDHQKFPVLKIVETHGDLSVAIDASTGLIRQVQVDFRRTLEKQDLPQIKSATATIDYLKTVVDPKLEATAFAWTPPKGVTLVKPDSPDQVAGGSGGAGEDSPAMQLVGKRAPDFKLEDTDGKSIAIADLKGKVVVLDFWATWCPPCRESLPHLNELARAHAADSMRVFAVNLSEGRDKAAGYVTENKLSDFTVLIDGDGSVAQKFLVSGIPQTVLIDKAGIVRKVIVGFGPGSEEELATAVTAALK